MATNEGHEQTSTEDEEFDSDDQQASSDIALLPTGTINPLQQVNVRIPAPLYLYLKVLAGRRQLSVPKFVLQLITEAVKSDAKSVKEEFLEQAAQLRQHALEVEQFANNIEHQPDRRRQRHSSGTAGKRRS